VTIGIEHISKSVEFIINIQENLEYKTPFVLYEDGNWCIVIPKELRLIYGDGKEVQRDSIFDSESNFISNLKMSIVFYDNCTRPGSNIDNSLSMLHIK
jgi:hypothetical protein